MNKRIFLNVMIVALLTFYMIFNIVYKRLVDKHEVDPQQEAVNVWEGSFLVPGVWQLIRLEMPSITLQLDDQGNWSSSDNNMAPTIISETATAWQNLAATSVSAYEQLPLKGQTILAFVIEDSQPLVFRVIEQGDEIHFYRMIDKKRFTFSQPSKIRLIPE